MTTHPMDNSFQFVGGGVSLEVVTPPAYQRDISQRVALAWLDPVNARGVVAWLPVVLVSVVDWETTARAVLGALDHINKIRDRKRLSIKRQIAFSSAVEHSLPHDAGPDLYGFCVFALALFLSLDWAVSVGILLATNRRETFPVRGFPYLMIGAKAFATRWRESVSTLFVGWEKFKRLRQIPFTFRAFFHRHNLSIIPRYWGEVWGNEIESTVELPQLRNVNYEMGSGIMKGYEGPLP